MLGIIIGVTSVVTTVSMGEGVKHQIVQQINQAGPDLITVRPGKVVTRDAKGRLQGISYFSSFTGVSLSEQDLKAVQSTEGVKGVAPFSAVATSAETDNQEYDNAMIIGTTSALPDLLNHRVEFGSFFTADEKERDVAVIGKRVAEQLFQENVPVGKTMRIKGQTFIVRGVFEEFETAPLVPNADYNTAIFIPYEAGKILNQGAAPIYQIMAKPTQASQTGAVVNRLDQKLSSLHGDSHDFTILKQTENLQMADGVLSLLTALIAGIAGVSLVVGGIGIMNIMLVAVTERTHEIGVRKAVGATNRQIRRQFLTEALVLSVLGGVIGVLLSILANVGLRIFTGLKPVVTWPVIGLALAVAIGVGVIFGIMPALRAAAKDPIEALRHE
jgi:ABC-type antimicrobial peptide transport system permease subunit